MLINRFRPSIKINMYDDNNDTKNELCEVIKRRDSRTIKL